VNTLLGLDLFEAADGLHVKILDFLNILHLFENSLDKDFGFDEDMYHPEVIV